MSAEISRDSFFLVRVYGDSLSMPREFEGIPFFCIYPELLRRKLEILYPGKRICIYNRSSGGGTVKSLWLDYQRDSSYFRPARGHILIIQCGIVDCAPRPIPSTVGRTISRMPNIVQQIVKKLLHKYRPNILLSGFSWRHIIPAEFQSTLKSWLAVAIKDFERVYVINIAPTNSAIESHSPGLTSSIELYNKIISVAVKSIAASNLFLMDIHGALNVPDPCSNKHINEHDGHHLTLEGHKVYAELIADNEAAMVQGSQQPT